MSLQRPRASARARRASILRAGDARGRHTKASPMVTTLAPSLRIVPAFWSDNGMLGLYRACVVAPAVLAC